MATGRTLGRFGRVYVNGYDLSGYSRTIGPLGSTVAEADLTTLTDSVRGVLPNHTTITAGTLNGVMDNTATSGLHAVLNAPGTYRNLTYAQGIRGAPAAGDPTFNACLEQLDYQLAEDGGAVTVSIPFGASDAAQGIVNYIKPWGILLHANGAETAVNTAVGLDDFGAATTAGWWLVYHLLTSNGTVTLKVQDAATNLDGSFADLTGATSGSITAASAPVSGIVQGAITATVRRYLRWQIALGSATTATFVLSFVRG